MNMGAAAPLVLTQLNILNTNPSIIINHDSVKIIICFNILLSTEIGDKCFDQIVVHFGSSSSVDV